MSYPPQGGYPQQPPPGYPQYGPPQSGYQQYGYQQPAYAPPGYAYGPPPTPPRKRRGGLRALIGLVLFGVIAGSAVYVGSNQSDPQVGDCLSSMESGIFGLEVVKCDSSSAAYEVVERTTDKSQATEYILCKGHDNGEFYSNQTKRRKLIWAICATPV